MAILKDMLSSGKRLVVFEVQKHLNSPSWLHNMRDFVEHTDADWGNQPEGVESFDERLKKICLYLPDISSWRLPGGIAMISRL